MVIFKTGRRFTSSLLVRAISSASQRFTSSLLVRAMSSASPPPSMAPPPPLPMTGVSIVLMASISVQARFLKYPKPLSLLLELGKHMHLDSMYPLATNWKGENQILRAHPDDTCYNELKGSQIPPSLKSELDVHWKSIYRGLSNLHLWRVQWKTHGRAGNQLWIKNAPSMNSKIFYLGKALEVYKSITYDVAEIMDDLGIQWNITAIEILNIFKHKFGVEVQVEAITYMETKYFYQVHIGYDLDWNLKNYNPKFKGCKTEDILIIR